MNKASYKILTLVFLFMLLQLGYSEQALSGGNHGNGGDIIFCKSDSGISKYEGYFSLDWLMADYIGFHELVEGEIMEVERNLINKLRSISSDLASSIKAFWDTFESAKKSRFIQPKNGLGYRWITVSRLENISDEDLVISPPENCNQIYQAVNYRPIEHTFVLSYIQNVKPNSQLGAINHIEGTISESMLKTHEFSHDNFDGSRFQLIELVSYLYSKDFLTDSALEAERTLKRLGLKFNNDWITRESAWKKFISPFGNFSKITLNYKLIDPNVVIPEDDDGEGSEMYYEWLTEYGNPHVTKRFGSWFIARAKHLQNIEMLTRQEVENIVKQIRIYRLLGEKHFEYLEYFDVYRRITSPRWGDTHPSEADVEQTIKGLRRALKFSISVELNENDQLFGGGYIDDPRYRGYNLQERRVIYSRSVSQTRYIVVQLEKMKDH
jgi:hypothetical protein